MQILSSFWQKLILSSAILCFFTCSVIGQNQEGANVVSPEKLKELKNYVQWSFNYGSQKEFDSANKYSKKALVLAKTIGNEDLIGYAKAGRALSLYWQVNIKDAKEILQENLANELLVDSIRKESLFMLAEIGMYEKEYKASLPYMISIEKIIRKNDLNTRRDSIDLSRVYVAMGLLHEQLKNYETAHKYYDEALVYNVKSGNESYIMYYKAGLFEQENKLQQSIAITKKALAQGIKNKDHLFLPTYYLSLSSIFKKLKQPDSVIYFGKKGLVDNKDCQLDQLLAAVGNGYAMKSEYRTSINFLKEALDHSVSKTFELDIHKDLRDSYLGLKEYEKAFEHNKEFLRLKDSIDNLKVKQEIVAITEKYESNKKELEIEQLNTANLKSDLLIKEQRAQLIFTSLALLLAIAVLSSILYFYYQQKKQKQLLYDKNLQLARELRNKENKTLNTANTEAKLKLDSVNGMDNSQRNKLRESIEQLISDEFYLDREMSLPKMAKELETNTTYLSRIINEDYQKAFATFINELRLSHTLRSLEADSKYRKLTIDHIAYNSGFASSSTFYNAFKKFTGLTPSYYIKKRLEQEM